MKENILVAVGAFFIGIGLILIFSVLTALPVMLLWDWLMPTLFGLKEITLFQAWGVNFLCCMLFKGNSYNKNNVINKEPKKSILHG